MLAKGGDPKPPNLASRSYLKCVKNLLINDRNLLDFPDSFSILTRGFKFSDRPNGGLMIRPGLQLLLTAENGGRHGESRRDSAG